MTIVAMEVKSTRNRSSLSNLHRCMSSRE